MATQTEMKQMSDDIFVGPQPKADEFQQLAEQGIRTVINLRVTNEEDETLAPENEAELVRNQGMEYVHLPVLKEQIRTEQVNDFRNFLSTLPRPIFVHCSSGTRAGAFTMMHLAAEQGWSGKETLKKAEESGFKCDDAAIKSFVSDYVDSH